MQWNRTDDDNYPGYGRDELAAVVAGAKAREHARIHGCPQCGSPVDEDGRCTQPVRH